MGDDRLVKLFEILSLVDFVKLSNDLNNLQFEFILLPILYTGDLEIGLELADDTLTEWDHRFVHPVGEVGKEVETHQPCLIIIALGSILDTLTGELDEEIVEDLIRLELLVLDDRIVQSVAVVR